MKANINTVLVGSKVVLVPYRSEHVPKYHEWMLDEELRSLTASEPLSLEEEYEMQKKWQLDEDKLTFIILAPNPASGSFDAALHELFPTNSGLSPTDKRLADIQMVGDVNIFLNGAIPSPQEKQNQSSIKNSEEDMDDGFQAEVEIMIAEPSFRRKGLALEALQLMLGYATGQPQAFTVDTADTSKSSSTLNYHQQNFDDSPLRIPPSCLLTRISDTNTPSIRLFEKLGFTVTKRVEVFREVEMRWYRRLPFEPSRVGELEK